MLPIHDLFVGVIAIVLGCLLIAGATFDMTVLMSLAKPTRLADAVGKTAARCLIAAIGLAAIAMGILIASGWRIHW